MPPQRTGSSLGRSSCFNEAEASLPRMQGTAMSAKVVFLVLQ